MTKLLLIAAIVAVTGTIVAQDHDEAFAAHTSVFYTVTTSSPAATTSVVTFPGAPPKTLHVWASNVDDAQGLGAFEVILRYNPAFMGVGTINHSSAWLDDTNRTPSCLAPSIGPVPGDPILWQAKAVCFTITQPPPYGPLGSGKIAEFTILPGASYGITSLTNLTVLTDPGQVIPPNTVINPQVIPTNEISAQVRTAKCADVNPYPNGNGSVSASDFFAVLSKFGTVQGGAGWDQMFDLDANNAVASADVFIALAQFGFAC
jgi:hypothetical protein